MADSGIRDGLWRKVGRWIVFALAFAAVLVFGKEVGKWLRGRKARREGNVDEVLEEIEAEADKAHVLEQARLDALPDSEVMAPDRLESAADLRRESAGAAGDRERARLLNAFGLSDLAPELDARRARRRAADVDRPPDC